MAGRPSSLRAYFCVTLENYDLILLRFVSFVPASKVACCLAWLYRWQILFFEVSVNVVPSRITFSLAGTWRGIQMSFSGIFKLIIKGRVGKFDTITGHEGPEGE